MLQEWRVDLLPRQLSPYGAHTYHHSQGPIAVQKLPWTLFMRHPGSRSQQWANAKTPATTKGPTAKLLVRATYYSEAPSSHHPVMHPQAPSPERKGDLKPQQSGKRRCNDSLKDYQGSLFGTLSPVHPILTRVRTGQNGGATSNIKVAGRVTPWVIIIQNVQTPPQGWSWHCPPTPINHHALDVQADNGCGSSRGLAQYGST